MSSEADALVTLEAKGINRHGIDPQNWNIQSPTSEEATGHGAMNIWLVCADL